jgi:plastocyanin
VVRRLALTAVAAGLLVCAGAGPADAASRKVAVGDFRWSPLSVDVDRGDSVTWFWVGPDTQHSITGLSANALAIDSDPGDGAPAHAPGDRFTVRFDEPGTYELHCKLHALVRGTVVVSDTPGTGSASPDPDPRVTLDLTPPELTQVRWTAPLRYGRPAELRYTLDEPARITLDVMAPRRGPDRLVGTRRFSGHIGWNAWRFRGVLRHRRLPPGRYVALLVAADAAGNRTGDVRLPFRVRRSGG